MWLDKRYHSLDYELKKIFGTKVIKLSVDGGFTCPTRDGFKGYGVGANYTFAKNIVGTVVYYDTESKLDSKVDDQRVWADLTFTF